VLDFLKNVKVINLNNEDLHESIKATNVILSDIFQELKKQNEVLAEMNTNIKILTEKFGDIPTGEDGEPYVSINNTDRLGQKIARNMVY